MPAKVTLYAPASDPLPLATLRRLAPGAKVSARKSAAGRPGGYRVAWEDVRVKLNRMPEEQLAEHLSGFQGYVTGLAGGEGDDPVQGLLARIAEVRLVLGAVIDPDFDDEGKANKFILALLGICKALLFDGRAVYDEDAQLLLGPPEEDEDEAGAEGDEGEGWQPTPNQLERAERSKALARPRRMPLYLGPLFVDDDQEVTLRTPADVARRALVLWVVAQRGEGLPQDKALALLDRLGVRDALSPQEKAFLDDAEPDPQVAGRFVWRLEALWVLLWALGHIDELGWPEGFCDVRRVVGILRPREGDPAFVTAAALRPAAAILDAQDLTMRVHWAIRDTWLKKQPIPTDLDWSAGAERVPVEECPAVGVVEQRHHALNWLVFFGGDDWDDIDTPT